MIAGLVLALVIGIADTCPTNGHSVFPAMYANAVRKAGGVPVPVRRTVRPEDLDGVLARIDLLLLPGGEDVSPARYCERPSPALGRVNLERDEFEFRLLRAAVRRRLPIVGTCRGAQILNVFFCGTLYQDMPSELGERYTVEHRTGRDIHAARRDYRHGISIVPGSRLAAACGTLSAKVNSLHHQSVKTLGMGMKATAFAPDGVVEAIECTWYPAAGIQFHPECLSTLISDPLWGRFYSNIAAFAGK